MAFIQDSQLINEVYGKGRRRYFLRTALVVLLAGFVFTILQPRQYMSNATVLMSAPTAIDQTMLEADAGHARAWARLEAIVGRHVPRSPSEDDREGSVAP